ncbi:DUF1176 domain-containing protein [Phreatobacter sp.]|uniref:DUF1176 domain-containing protein n=1 Tax=Phreatobacter sp. TaxID=1966341 RepID=UPI0022C6CFE7|nr:DUF1176 domain-containing protein [Phreatobacter sp.]MCZ8314815.1 DUF1176 domain-containing protein [Phreatobacter sp.]
MPVHHTAARLLLAATLGLATTAVVAQEHAAERGQIRSFRDWMVGCDNTRSCRAFALPAIENTGKAALRIDRGGEAAEEARVTIILGQDVSLLPGARLRLVPATGAAIEITAGRDATEVDGDVEVTDATASRRLLAALRTTDKLSLTLMQKDGAAVPAGVISLDGASAALLWMDERQKRIGTRTALVRPDTASTRVVPPPLAPPAAPPPVKLEGGPPPTELPEPMLQAVLDAYRALPAGSCDASPEESAESLSADRLAPGLLLVGLRCLAGAYNEAQAFYIVTEGDRPTARPASFARLREPAPEPDRMRSETQPDNILWNSELDDTTGTISHVAKGRGFADCGEMGSWRWDGRAFRPVDLSFMPACRGLLPPNWLTIYRTR